MRQNAKYFQKNFWTLIASKGFKNCEVCSTRPSVIRKRPQPFLEIALSIALSPYSVFYANDFYHNIQYK